MSVLTVLTLIFMILKLTGYIDWSWWLVVAPSILWCVMFLIAVISRVFETPEARLRRILQNRVNL